MGFDILFVFINVFKIILSENDIIPYIHKGKNADIGYFPSTVQIRKMDFQFCGGTLISPKHVLTAGHCIPSSDVIKNGSFTIICGSLNRDPKALDRNAQKRIVLHACIHKKYSFRRYQLYSKLKHDIAVLELEAPVRINENCQTAELGTVNSRVGTKCNMTGWGFDGIETNPKGNLTYKDFEIRHPLECARYNIFTWKLKICIKDRSGAGASGIPGDSGGPLYCKGKVEGVLSMAMRSHFTIAMSVPSYYKWIKKFVQEGDKSECSTAMYHDFSLCTSILTIVLLFRFF